MIVDPITSGYNLSKINANFQKVEDELNNKVLYRDSPTGEPNSMSSNLDMNSKSILNANKIYSNILELGGVQVVPANLAVDPYNGTREALRRSYAEAGYSLIGTFSNAGLVVNTATDVVLWEPTGIAYSYSGTLPYTIGVGETPIGNSQWVSKSGNTLREEVTAPVGSGIVGFQQAGAGSVPRTAQDKMRESVSILDFGAVPGGVVNARQAVKNAAAAVNASGGGEVVIPQGDFLISGFDGTYTVKEIDGTLQYVDSTLDIQIYFAGLNNVEFRFDGGRFISDKTDGGTTIAFDGGSNITLTRPCMMGATVMSGSTVTTTGTSAITLLSRDANLDGVTIIDPKIDKHYANVDISGDPSSSFRVSNVTVDGVPKFTNGYYGLACRGNGYNVRMRNAYSNKLNRPFFIYDTTDVAIQIIGDEMNGGFQSLIKAYTTNTINIDIYFSVRGRSNVANCLGLQSQHNPALQPTPAYLKNIKVRYTDQNSVVGESIRFDYYRDAVATATSSSLLFTEIELNGAASGDVYSSVSLTNNSNQCVLHMEDFACNNGKSIFAGGSGFVPSAVGNWTPTDGSGAGLVMANAVGKYVVGNVVTGVFSLSYPVTANGAAAKISGLPVRAIPLSSNAQSLSVSYTDVGFDIYGLIEQGGTTVSFYKNTGVAVANSELSGKHLRGSFSYIA